MKGVLPTGSFVTCSSDDTIRVWNLDPNMGTNTIYRRNIYSNVSCVFVSCCCFVRRARYLVHVDPFHYARLSLSHVFEIRHKIRDSLTYFDVSFKSSSTLSHVFIITSLCFVPSFFF